jgi:DNA invertase Pin-like site-specific DNA recombinase
MSRAVRNERRAQKSHSAQRFQQLRDKSNASVETQDVAKEDETKKLASSAPVRAAQYVRMSTDRQEYSIEHQSVANHAYAACNRMEIVRTYADAGKSGLTLIGRDALKQLIDDVLTGNADFAAVLVYDVTRWGRFQDADESGYYEHMCKRAGINVHYCAEQFQNDGTPFAAVVKAIKRAMAAEYSRELSVKSFAGQSHLIRLGFRAGSAPGFGLRRLLIDKSGTPKLILGPGQRKSISDDRVLLILGPEEELRTVRWIFSTFVNDGKSEGQIAKILNEKGIGSGVPRPWTPARVRWLLGNENYIGNILWNRTSVKLGRKKVDNPPEIWFRAKTSFAPIIDIKQFEAVKRIFLKRRERLTKERILEALRRLYHKHGFLDTWLVIDSKEVPSITSIHKHLGGLKRAYKLIGSKGPPGATYGLSDDELLARLRRLLRKRGRLTEQIINQSEGIPHSEAYRRRFGSVARAYRLIGYKGRPKSHQARWAKTISLTDEQVLEALRKLFRARGRLTQKIIDRNGETPTSPTYCKRFGSLARAYELVGYRPKNANQLTPRGRAARQLATSSSHRTEFELVDGTTGFLVNGQFWN